MLVIRPSKFLLVALTFWVGLGLLASFWPQLVILWWGTIAVIAIIAALDLSFLVEAKAVNVKRHLAPRLALAVEDEVVLELHNTGRRQMLVQAFDGIPDSAEAEELPWRGWVPAGGYAKVHYPVKMLRRGLAAFGATQLLIASPLRLWWRRRFVGEQETVKVYPNYEPLVRFTLLSMESSENQMGIVHKNRIGMSREFHQLREYQQGDVLSQIDWKATAKRRELISREYQEQRDQNIILAVDCSRRMRTLDGDISQFDHCLNAMLLLSFIALRQGDKVGVLGFGGETRWFPPTKGAHSMTALLNHLYDYQTSDYPTDFSEAAEELDVRQKRRSLVVVLTNVRGEDQSDLLPALRNLRRKHVVMLANLREGELDGNISTPVESLNEALTYGATRMYLEQRDQVFDTLSAHGILSLDSTAETLPIDLTNQYLKVKSSGQL